MIIFGTRPEIIKLAPILNALKKMSKKIKYTTLMTGQHKELARDFLNLFSIKTDYDLKIMRKNQSLSDIVINLVPKLEDILKKEKPDLVMIQGDTSSAFIACLCAFYLKIPIAHVEAGLRTMDKCNPFPEEMNRCLIDKLSDLYFCPTHSAKRNLIKEGISKKNIFVVGNTVVDSLFNVMNKRKKTSIGGIFKNVDFTKKILVVTIHRRETHGIYLERICKAIRTIVHLEKGIEVVFSVHPNPNVVKKVYSFLKGVERVHLIKPLNYIEFIYLVRKSYLILTDSGGIQEEAPYLKKPVLVLRKKSERTEAIKTKVVKMTGVTQKNIMHSARILLHNKAIYKKMVKSTRPYGSGKSSEKIIKILLKNKNNFGKIYSNTG